MKLLQSHSKLTQIQTRLAKQSYLSRANLPGWADGKMFIFLQSIKRYPDRKIYPNFYHWYILMKQFSLSSLQKWVSNIMSQDDDPLILQFITYKLNQKQKTLSDSLNFKKQKQSELITDQNIKLIRSEDLTSPNSNQIQYIMDVKIKQQNNYNIRELLMNFLHNQDVEHQTLQIIPQQRRVRIVTKIDSAKCDYLINKLSHLEGVEKVESKKKDKKFQTINSLNNFVNSDGRE